MKTEGCRIYTHAHILMLYTTDYPGDKIVVTSTDFDWEQAEVREIVECSDCSASQIRVNGEFARVPPVSSVANRCEKVMQCMPGGTASVA